jgi:2-hydroxychromene-2-carboxylate isomerase
MPTPLPVLSTSFGHGHHERAYPEVQFYFDIVCPYAYLASLRLPEFCQRLGARLVYRPVLLGGVLKALDSDPSGGPVARQQMTRRDLGRWADHLGVPLRYPAAHPLRTVEAMRLICWAPPLCWPSLIAALYRAYWVEGRDISEVSVLIELAASVGLEAESVWQGLHSREVAQSLRRRTDEAVAAGVFGVPTMVVDGNSTGGPRLFFGQDRLHFVEEAVRHHPLFRPPQAEPQAEPAPPTIAADRDVANQARRVTFYYDFGSPYAYLASTQIERVAAHCGAVVDWRPIVLGGLFRAIGTPQVPLAGYPESKRRHCLEDMARWARHYNEPFHFPSRFPMLTVTALRLALLAGERIGELSRALFNAYWVGNEDLQDLSVLQRVLELTGLPKELLERVSEPAIKDQLRRNTEQAEQLGVFGVPSFVVARHHDEPQLFFGQDRLIFVEKALRS